MRLILLMIAFSGVFAPAGAKEPALPVESIARKALPALVTVLIKDEKGQLIKSGSGFFVAARRVVTNLHVISGGKVVSVATLDRKEFTVASARIDEPHDLAVLECPDATAVTTLRLGDPGAVAIGESVVAAGSPLGMQGTISTGIVSAKRIVKGVAVIQTTAPISRGSSGGPLINSRGEVIGINSFAAVDGQNLNFAQLSSHVTALMKGGGKAVDFRRGESIATTSDKPDPNQDVVLWLLARPAFSGLELKKKLIGNAELVFLDARRKRVYFALSQADAGDGNVQARVTAVAATFVADPERVIMGTDEGLQARFPDYTFQRSPAKWAFFATDIDNVRLRTQGGLTSKYRGADYTISTGELRSFAQNASLRGGPLRADSSQYVREAGTRALTNWGAIVARPAEPSLTRFVKELVKEITEPDKKIQRLADFVAGEIQTNPSQTDRVAKRPAETLLSQQGSSPDKAVLLASLLEQIPVDYLLVYSGQDVWVAVPQGSFKNDNGLEFAYSGRQWALIDVSRPGFVIGQTKPPGAVTLDRLLFAQLPQQDGRIYHRTTGMPLQAH
ncbi:trypsin-like peptidase domain-containing protein [Reyranella sp. CPCC 100927]|uniref:trypsin-like peptidase domain-containing protein n=1 Tax=Reyranella sp. CPCC 100927 TaxID=2599616 RepID=UPI0015B3871E|nr:trypsin-like peptidase domain-containing protein [Reyranella sp. CPCC 100927]